MDTDKLFLSANNLLREGKLQEAISIYELLLSTSTGALAKNILFNLGLANRRVSSGNLDRSFSISHIPIAALRLKPENLSPEEWVSQCEMMASEFDSQYYFSRYPDIEEAGVDPLLHYFGVGWREGRNPNSDFSTKFYLESNDDVAKAQINPFWHYICAGRKEGRLARHPGGYKADVLRELPTFKQTVKHWGKTWPEKIQSLNELTQEILNCSLLNPKGVLICLGHDNYLKISGGIQLCLQQEQKNANKQNIIYLNAHPFNSLPTLASIENDPDPLLRIILNGREIGTFKTSTITEAIAEVSPRFENNIHVVIHSLLGHSIHQVVNLVKKTSHDKCSLWLHDFFTLCPSFTLQRNSISFCGAPNLDSNACAICVYGEERKLHTQQIEMLFNNVEVTIISPSEITREFWLSKSTYPVKEIFVIPHVLLEWQERIPPLNIAKNTPISIAFVGAPVDHKGWPVFANLVSGLNHDSRFRFLYFGNYKPPLSGVKHVNVHVTSQDELAMVRAIMEAEIDYVIHWASWPETFSFTTYEAMAAGAYVLTNSISGNVAAVVNKTNRGFVFECEQQLMAYFIGDAATNALDTIRNKRSKYFSSTQYSGMPKLYFAKDSST